MEAASYGNENILRGFFLIDFSCFPCSEEWNRQSEGSTETCMPAMSRKCSTLSPLLVEGCAAQMLGFDLYCDLYLGNLMDFSGSA